MAAVFSKTTKLMLKNVICHTNSHNKTVEESEMWQNHERVKELGGLDPSNPSFGHDDRCTARTDRERRRNDYWNSRSEKRAYLSTSSHSRRAHMDEEEEKGRAGISTSTYWMRQLEKLESSDPNRWDHGGYREMYPQDFRSDHSDSDSSRQLSHSHKEDGKSKKKKKKKKHCSRSKKERQKVKKSSHRHRKRARRQEPSSPSDDSESDSFSSDSSSSSHQRPQAARPNGREKMKSYRYSSSESSSSGSCSDSDSRERPSSRKQNQRKRTHNSSVPKPRHKTKPSRYTSSGSSTDSDSDSDFRGRSQSDRKTRKRTRRSSVSASSTDRSASVSPPARKKGKTLKSGRKVGSQAKKRSKHKRQNGGNIGHDRRADRKETESQLVVKMWKKANRHAGSSKNSEFDRRVRTEISSQYCSLKQEYGQKRHDRKAEVNGGSEKKSRKRRRYSSSSSSSESD
ncbi:hypothetical protein ACOMHN_061426 [Nucella lapillus]